MILHVRLAILALCMKCDLGLYTICVHKIPHPNHSGNRMASNESPNSRNSRKKLCVYRFSIFCLPVHSHFVRTLKNGELRFIACLSCQGAFRRYAESTMYVSKNTFI